MELSEDSIWFSNNVFFIFSSGCIFSEDDKRRLDGILTLFKSRGNSRYLMNKVMYANYENDKMRSVENKLAIVNGNYHICAVIGVYESADITKAPEPSLARHGLISYHFSWDDIQTTIIEYIKKYGYDAKIEDTEDCDNDKFVIKHKDILDMDLDNELVESQANTLKDIKEFGARKRSRAVRKQRKLATDQIRNDYYEDVGDDDALIKHVG